MNSTPAVPPPPSAPSGNGMIIIFVVIVLVLLGVGGYFVYQKFFSPSAKCPKQDSDAKSHVSTFVWDSDSNSCVANVCMDGYGDAATGGEPVSGKCSVYTAPAPAPAPAPRIYSPQPAAGLCADHVAPLKPMASPSASTDTDCRTACDNSTSPCLAYDWSAGVADVCNLYSQYPSAYQPVAGATGTCSKLNV
jgi:hypothetical protein